MPKQSGALGRAEIAAAIGDNLRIQRKDARRLTDSIIDLMGQALEDGEQVMITNFGTFKLYDKPERPGRNPRNGEDFTISPRRVVVFKPSSALRRYMLSAGTDQPADD